MLKQMSCIQISCDCVVIVITLVESYETYPHPIVRFGQFLSQLLAQFVAQALTYLVDNLHLK